MSDLMKPVAQTEEIDNVEALSNTQKREEAIRAGVLKALGCPADLLRVSVLPLWGNKFRVNVWTSSGNGNGIPNSYFVTVADDGNIVKSDPPIQKLY